MAKRVGTKKRRALVDALVERDGSFCTWCCKPLIDAPIHPFQDCSAHMTLEHVVPLRHGGTYDLSNLALACFECNNSRGACLVWSAS